MPLPTASPASAVEEARVAAAFEHGRSTERARLAQDLHDDIGARLLTLMVRARDPALVDALRETLRDLKALTRGLSTPRARLSEAAADWHADTARRLAEADVALRWQLDTGTDTTLDAEQWQALTRILRELLSNAIAHARATTLAVHGAWHDGWLTLSVEDDGTGRAPQAWAQGLGLSGVRRRVHDLGGSVTWEEGAPRGIRCTVRVPLGPAQPRPGASGSVISRSVNARKT